MSFVVGAVGAIPGATYTGTARRAVSAWANNSCSGYTDDNEIRTPAHRHLDTPSELDQPERMMSKRALASSVPCRPARRRIVMRMPAKVEKYSRN